LVFADSTLRDLIDLKIFLDVDADIRLARRICRDVKERGRGIESVIDQWLKTVRPMHEKYVAPASKYANVVYKSDPSEEDLKIQIDKIRKHT